MFQIDSEIVRSVYNNLPNYKIDYDDSCTENICAIYFSSNDIYFPNTDEIFRKRIVEKDFFEWYHTRVKARKHIFVRDVFKQWYLEGINAEIDSPEKLYEWLKQETGGQNVVTIGSSAGGYAAVLYGSLLRAKKVIAFNAQFSLYPMALPDRIERNPLVFKYKDSERARFFELKNLLCTSTNYWYFASVDCDEDKEQYLNLFVHPYPIESLKCIRFKTSHHGIPFLKVALKKVLSLDDSELLKFTKGINHPITFTLRMVGIKNTIKGFLKQVYIAYRKRK